MRPLSIDELRRVARAVRERLPGLPVQLDGNCEGVQVYMPLGTTDDDSTVMASAWCAVSQGQDGPDDEPWVIEATCYSTEAVVDELVRETRQALHRETVRHEIIAAALRAAHSALSAVP